MPKSSTRSRPDPAVTRQWAERFERFRSAHHTVAAFCAAEGVSQATFYQWKRRLAPPTSSSARHVPAVVPLRLLSSPLALIELALPSGAVVRFPADTRPEVIVAVLRGMEADPC